MSQHKPFKISQLPNIVDISKDDMLIVSDISGKSISSKKMSLKQLVEYVASQLNPQMKSIADESANSVAREVAVAEVNEAIDSVVLPQISQQVEQALDGQVDDKVAESIENYDIEPKVIRILDTLGDDKVDNVINVNGGSAS